MRILGILICLFITSCGVRKTADINYLPKDLIKLESQPSLNVFSPKKAKYQNTPVLLFVHGGNWNSGKKELYNFYGNNFAKKGITTVVVGYTLSPAADYKMMTTEIAEAIKWTQQNISKYKGDPKRLFLTGHSAGGHLVALATMDSQFGIDPDSISGIILNDAAGLDMHHYLQQYPPTKTDNYNTTWTNDEETWKIASPIFYVSESTPKIMMYVGEKTYPSISIANKRFLKALKPFQPNLAPIFLNKKHIPMMTQFIWPWNNRYDEIIDFIESQ
ncbi:alpha/beta hydrolase family protein [Gillisia mitskevichiae]|uniref:Alpha/beta hydrolase family protein n=1 Tax=Gillisia mitskevichiae TaxID=270921 RepID=A0A495PV60_9FLAO|nr:alpha/beta hydrolase [Gillisia mitskevichiae]RKS53655.1 alpha/beta hydrolase family protein [Gillisia mitskevichiae]